MRLKFCFCEFREIKTSVLQESPHTQPSIPFLVLLTFLGLETSFQDLVVGKAKLPRSVGPLVNGGLLDGTAMR